MSYFTNIAVQNVNKGFVYVSINSMAAHPPPRAFVGHLSFWRKNVANAPLWGPNNATKSPPLGTYIDTNAPPLGTKYKFSEDF
jgi:hypothetical protein